MLYFSLLGSGSSGNAVLIASGTTQILIDSGFSFKELNKRVQAIGRSLDTLDAIFVTHEHGDHVKGIGVLTRKINTPVYITEPTFASLSPSIGQIPNVIHFESGDRIGIGNLEVASFNISHDAVDPVAYTVQCGNVKLGFAADLGHVSQLVRQRLHGSHALVLEANHCPKMLQIGPYPPQLQQRIRSRIGHLSNQDMCSLLHELLHDGLQTVVLMHVSEKNNTYDMVRRMASTVVDGHNIQVMVAEQDMPTPWIKVSE